MLVNHSRSVGTSRYALWVVDTLARESLEYAFRAHPLDRVVPVIREPDVATRTYRNPFEGRLIPCPANWLTTPEVVIRPMELLPSLVNHKAPSGPSTMPWGVLIEAAA